MAYTGSDDKTLPAKVLKLIPEKRAVWVTTYNAAFKNAKNSKTVGGTASDTEADTTAAKMADMSVTKMAHEDATSFDGMTAFLMKLREQLSDKVDTTTWTSAVRTARASAGGKGKAFKLRATCEEHKDATLSVITACEYCDDPYETLNYSQPVPPDEDEDDEPHLEKADSRVMYTQATEVGMTCGDCKFFSACDNECGIVEGMIERTGTCNLFTPMGHTMGENALTKFGSLFVATSAFSEVAPDWMPFMPIPGTYKHPRWGDITLSKERLQRFVDNFTNKVYQEQLPIDAEHESKLSGAVGWITGLRTNSDNSVDARVNWTDRGKALVQAGGYRYVSPEWWDEWVQPESGVQFKDVPIGAAITTRPFFKERALRPLLAAEDGTITVMEEYTMVDPTPTPTPKSAAEVQRDFETYKAASELRTTALAEQVKTMETNNLRRAFTDEVLGRSDANNVRWIGDTEKNVASLMRFAEVFGSESEQVKEHVTLQRTTSAAVRTSGAFAEKGSSAASDDGSDTSAYGEITRRSNELVKEGKAKTFSEAMVAVLNADKPLGARYEKERD